MTYRRKTKYYLLRFLRIATSPFSAAGGFACGMFVHFHLTTGLGLPLAFTLAKMTRTSCIAASLAWALTMPFFPIFFYLNFLTGDFIFGESTPDIFLAIQDLAILKFSRFLTIGKAFIIGSIINSLIAFFSVWFLGFIFLKKYRRKALNFVLKYL